MNAGVPDLTARFFRSSRWNAVRTRTRQWCCGGMILSGMVGGTPLRAQVPDESIETVHFGFSAAMFQDVNANDAQAAMKVWSGVIAAERNIPISPITQILDGVPAIAAAMREHRLEAITLSTREYWEVNRLVGLGEIIIGSTHGEISENYVLIVQAKSAYQSLADLRGRTLNTHQSSRTLIARPWLDTELLENGLGTCETFFAQLKEETKLSRVVLPVFFGQSDACLVTRSGFDIMCELNPQLAKQLRILAESPEYIPSIFAFRGDWDSPHRDALLAVLEDVDQAPAGRQTLALFQQDDLQVRPVSDLEPTLELLRRHTRLLSEQRSPAAAPTPPETTP